MKKLFILAAAVIVGFSSCYKEEKPAQAFDVLTRHKWIIEAHVNGVVDSGVNCRIPSEVEFDKDSTGYFYYTSLCDPADSFKRSFRWTVSYNNKLLYFATMQGTAYVTQMCAISYYDDKVLRLNGPETGLRYMDGYFRAFGDK